MKLGIVERWLCFNFFIKINIFLYFQTFLGQQKKTTSMKLYKNLCVLMRFWWSFWWSKDKNHRFWWRITINRKRTNAIKIKGGQITSICPLVFLLFNYLALWFIQYIVKKKKFFNNYFWTKAFIPNTIFVDDINKVVDNSFLNYFSRCFIFNNGTINFLDRYIFWNSYRWTIWYVWIALYNSRIVRLTIYPWYGYSYKHKQNYHTN